VAVLHFLKGCKILTANNAFHYYYLFGPVPSRRLGRSLGVDPVPFKTCTFNCIYCQIGATTCLTDERMAWVPVADILAELEHFLEHDGVIDAITVGGSGEPTLHEGLGELMDGIIALRARFYADRPAPRICLLTNGSLLYLPEVSAASAKADSVKITFSAANEKIWRELHRHVSTLTYEKALDGLIAFRAEFAGEIRLEVMVVEGVNADSDTMRAIAALTARIHPDKVELNTVVRPPAEMLARPVAAERMEELALLFDPPAEVIGVYKGPALEMSNAAPREDAILALIARHPSTVEDIAGLLGAEPNVVEAALRSLEANKRAFTSIVEGRVYYMAMV
jgi:wyosine [tRNA(Phe)-imidazoG37] synthetase (radical SAM superfamily)